MPVLRYVDPAAPPGLLTRLMARIGTNRVANAVSRRVNWKLDPWLLRLSRGRLATTLVVPTAVLETRGARTGLRRRNAVIYFNDSATRVVIVASHAGEPNNPGWYHNLRAEPSATIGGVRARASVVEDPAERARLWSLADNVFPGFRAYRESAASTGRTIPLVALDLE
jgi:deazaflavin-dependent oxidoreductase (nitroreductase family)